MNWNRLRSYLSSTGIKHIQRRFAPYPIKWARLDQPGTAEYLEDLWSLVVRMMTTGRASFRF